MRPQYTCIKGVAEEKEAENIFFVIMAEKFPNLLKNTKLRIQEAQIAQVGLFTQIPTDRLTSMMLKIRDKRKILKQQEKKQVISDKVTAMNS